MDLLNIVGLKYFSTLFWPLFSQLSKDRSSKHVKHHSSSPGAMYRPSESGQPRTSTVSRSKSDVSSRKNAAHEYPHFQEGYRRAESSAEVYSYYPFGVVVVTTLINTVAMCCTPLDTSYCTLYFLFMAANSIKHNRPLMNAMKL